MSPDAWILQLENVEYSPSAVCVMQYIDSKMYIAAFSTPDEC